MSDFLFATGDRVGKKIQTHCGRKLSYLVQGLHSAEGENHCQKHAGPGWVGFVLVSLLPWVIFRTCTQRLDGQLDVLLVLRDIPLGRAAAIRIGRLARTARGEAALVAAGKFLVKLVWLPEGFVGISVDQCAISGCQPPKLTVAGAQRLRAPVLQSEGLDEQSQQTSLFAPGCCLLVTGFRRHSGAMGACGKG